MYVIRHRATGAVLTSCTDRRRADALCSGHEHLVVRYDRGGMEYYRGTRRRPWGQEHPYDTTARQLLEAERDALVAAWHARRAAQG